MSDPATTNLAQTKIKKQIRLYLKKLKRSPDMIEAFRDGYCHGLAVLAAYSQFVSSQPNHQSPSDDWDWFEGVLSKLSRWNGRLSHLSADTRSDIDRLIGLIEFFQHVSRYLPHGQGSLDAYLIDTTGRTLTQEYTFAALLKDSDFHQPLQLESRKTDLIHELLSQQQRLIMISCGRHTLSLFRHHNQVTLYNSNNRAGLAYFDMNNLTALTRAISNAYSYQPDVPSPLGFRIFTFDHIPAPYPAASSVLDQLNTPLISEYPGNRKNYTALHIAARIGSLECVNYFLSRGADIAAEDRDGQTARRIAQSRRFDEIVNTLQRGKPVNDAVFSNSGHGLFTAKVKLQSEHPEAIVQLKP